MTPTTISRLFFASAAALALLGAPWENTSIAAQAQTTRVDSGRTETITAHGACRRVTNNTGQPLMVPHNTVGEWLTSGAQSFLSRVPSGVSVGACEATMASHICAYHFSMSPPTQFDCMHSGLVGSVGPGSWPSNIDLVIGVRDRAQFLTFHTRSSSLPATTLTTAQCGAVLGESISNVSASNLPAPIFPELPRAHVCHFSTELGTSWNDLTDIATSICSSLSGISRIYYVRTFTNGAQTAVSRGELWTC